jgi:hypothetical protein
MGRKMTRKRLTKRPLVVCICDDKSDLELWKGAENYLCEIKQITGKENIPLSEIDNYEWLLVKKGRRAFEEK